MAKANIHECIHCPHLASQHRLVRDAPIEGPYRCLHCECEMQRVDPTHLITETQMYAVHADELEDAAHVVRGDDNG